MNSSTFTGNKSRMTLQDAEWQRFVRTGIPFTIVLSMFSVIGTCGNISVLLTIRRRVKTSNYKILISCLAAVDLLGCSICIPMYIVNNRFHFSSQSDAVCKLSTVFLFFVGISSVNILTFTSVERYRKTCKPLGKQFSQKQTKMISCCLLGHGMVTALLSLVSFGSNKLELRQDGYNITGYSCVFEKEKLFSKVYNFIFVVGLFVNIAICSTCLYGIFGRVIILQSKLRPRMATYRLDASRNISLETKAGTDNSEILTPYNRDFSGDQSTFSSISVVSSKQGELGMSIQCQTSSNMVGKSLYNKSTQISFMFLICSFLSCASFVPLLVYKCMYSFDSLPGTIFYSLDPYAKISYRFHVFNHVINPFVYCIISNHFRKECKRILCKLKN